MTANYYHDLLVYGCSKYLIFNLHWLVNYSLYKLFKQPNRDLLLISQIIN